MARNRPKKALYEVMSKSRLDSNASPKVEPLRPPETVNKDTKTTVVNDTPASEISVKWWKRPKWLQINSGRIEISLPYQIAILIVLLLILLFLAAFRLGQLEQKTVNPDANGKKNA